MVKYKNWLTQTRDCFKCCGDGLVGKGEVCSRCGGTGIEPE